MDWDKYITKPNDTTSLLEAFTFVRLSIQADH